MELPSSFLQGHTGRLFFLAVCAVTVSLGGFLTASTKSSTFCAFGFLFVCFQHFSHLVSDTWILKHVPNHVLLRPHYLLILMNTSH